MIVSWFNICPGNVVTGDAKTLALQTTGWPRVCLPEIRYEVTQKYDPLHT